MARRDGTALTDQQPKDASPRGFDKADKEYLTTRQYRDPSNLNARGSLHARFSTNPQPWFRWLFDELLAIASADARIVEIGCGPAGLWAENLDRLPVGWRVALTDLSDGMVAAASARLAAAPPDVFTVQQADAENLPFADASFDVAIANHMLYHVPDRPKALSELRRVLKPAGALLAATNGENNMGELNEFLGGVDENDRAWRASFRQPFTLENGGEQLASCFDTVEIHKFPDSLRVTDESALVAYVNSIDIPGLRAPERQAAVIMRIHERMAGNGGVFNITKSVGVFIAHAKPA
jgi:SAM-dependent methyltransferase